MSDSIDMCNQRIKNHPPKKVGILACAKLMRTEKKTITEDGNKKKTK